MYFCANAQNLPAAPRKNVINVDFSKNNVDTLGRCRGLVISLCMNSHKQKQDI